MPKAAKKLKAICYEMIKRLLLLIFKNSDKISANAMLLMLN